MVLYPILLSQSWSTTVPNFMLVSGIAQSGQNLALSRLATWGGGGSSWYHIYRLCSVIVTFLAILATAAAAAAAAAAASKPRRNVTNHFICIWRSQDAEKVTYITWRLLDQAMILFNCVPFQNGNFS